MTVTDVDITTPSPTMRTYLIKKPDLTHTGLTNGDWGQIRLSPKGDRLAWIYASSRPSGIRSWISFWTKHIYAGGNETLDLWVSSLDKSAPRYVGAISGRQVSPAPEVAWTPDGRSLNLKVDGSAYAVPVD